MHVATVTVEPMIIHLACKSQIALLKTDKILVTIPIKYSNFTYVYSKKSVVELSEHTEINTNAIDPKEGKQAPYRPIYSLGPVELETLKIYIKTNLANGFIRPSKSFTSTYILFDWKPNGSLRFSVDYRDLNNLTIKNQYPLLLIKEFLDQLSHSKHFTQLDLTNAYHQIKIKEGNKWKTTFWTWYGYFKYQMMPFGLSNTPASFQGSVNKILAEKLDIFIIGYLDNIFIYIKNTDQGHVNAVWWVLEILRKYGLFANLKKGCFH